MKDPIEALEDIADALDVGRPASPETMAWWMDGWQRHIEQGISLEQALGLATSGRSARVRFLISRRNVELRKAWRLCDGSTPWRKSKALAEEIKRYRSCFWPRYRDHSESPHADRLRTALFRAFRLGAMLNPDDPRHDGVPGLRELHNICRDC